MARTAVLAASAARTTTGNSGTTFITTEGEIVSLMVDCTAVSGTTPSMTVSLQWSNDGAAWATGDPADSMTALTTAATVAKNFVSRGQFARASWTITGTTPSFTFSASAYTGG